MYSRNSYNGNHTQGQHRQSRYTENTTAADVSGSGYRLVHSQKSYLVADGQYRLISDTQTFEHSGGYPHYSPPLQSQEIFRRRTSETDRALDDRLESLLAQAGNPKGPSRSARGPWSFHQTQGAMFTDHGDTYTKHQPTASTKSRDTRPPPPVVRKNNELNTEYAGPREQLSLPPVHQPLLLKLQEDYEDEETVVSRGRQRRRWWD